MIGRCKQKSVMIHLSHKGGACMEFQLYYTEQGQGTPFVLLHGNGESSDYFSHQIEHFSKTYRVIAVDTRGHGKSPRGDAPFTLAQFVEDLKQLLAYLELKKIILLGFSDGGNIAMMFTLKYPQYVKKLILNGANLTAKGVKSSVQIPIIFGYWITSLFSLFSKNAKASQEMLRLMVKEPNVSPDELEQIAVPTLVIAGKQDMIKEHHTKLIAKSIPKSELILIEGDHFIANKESAVFNEKIESFLCKHAEE